MSSPHTCTQKLQLCEARDLFTDFIVVTTSMYIWNQIYIFHIYIPNTYIPYIYIKFEIYNI